MPHLIIYIELMRKFVPNQPIIVYYKYLFDFSYSFFGLYANEMISSLFVGLLPDTKLSFVAIVFVLLPSIERLFCNGNDCKTGKKRKT